jgi:hypothetical protein
MPDVIMARKRDAISEFMGPPTNHTARRFAEAANAVCSEATAQKASAPILPRFPGGRRTKSVPPPHRMCPQLTGRTPARTCIWWLFRAFSFTSSLSCFLAVVCGGRVLLSRLAITLEWFKLEKHSSSIACSFRRGLSPYGIMQLRQIFSLDVAQRR